MDGVTISDRPYQICVRCLMDTTNPFTRFDEEGVCSFCREYETAVKTFMLSETETRKEFAQLVDRMKEAGRGKEYDCLLGVSGGVDSSYLAYIVKQLGLRTLAVQFDNGWNSELAVKNIEVLCTKLGMDLHTYVVDWEEFRDLQLAFFRSGVANLEAPSDHGIFAALYRIADQYRIKYILDGNNLVTEQISVRAYGYNYGDIKQLRAIYERFGSGKLRTFPQMGLLRLIYYQKVRGIRQISLLNYVPYNKAEAIKTLEREVGWRNYGGKHQESIITRFHQAYVLPRKFKLDKRRAHLSNLIFSGQMTREEALAELAKPPYAPEMIEADCEYFIKKLVITESEFERIMAEPPKSYRDYPNEEWLYDLYAGLGRSRNALRLVLRRKQ